MTTSKILLPVGCEAMFYGAGSAGDQIKFGFDPDGLIFLTQEVISQGALGIATYPASPLAANRRNLPLSLRPRVSIVDRQRHLEARVALLLRPVAIDLGHDPDALELITDPIIGPQILAQNMSTEQRSSWSDLIVVYSNTYHLLLGMEKRLQIDIPIRLYEQALRRLREAAPGGSAQTITAALQGVVHAYRPEHVSSLRPLTPLLSEATPEWVQAFQEILEDEEFHQYSQARQDLGFPHHVDLALRRAWTLAKRLAAKPSFGSIFKVGQRAVSLSTGVPADAVDLDAYFRQTRYLPPIVSIAHAIADAQRRWLTVTAEYSQAISFSHQGFEWLVDRFSFAQVRAEISVDREYLASLYRTSPPLEPQEPEYPALLEHLFATNLTPPYICPLHSELVSIDEINTEWTTDLVTFQIESCCESAAKEGWAQMCAYDPAKKYQYKM